MSVAYQSWEVATGQKAYQCVMDGSPYRWQQQVEPAALAMFIHNSDEPTVDASKSCGAQTAVSPVTQSVLRHGECGPVSSFVLPCSSIPGTKSVLRHGECGPVSSFVLPCSSIPPGSERVALIGEEMDPSKVVGRINVGQRSLLNGFNFGPKKIHPHEPEFGHFDEPMSASSVSGFSTDCGVVPTTGASTLFKTVVGPSLSSSSSSIGIGACSLEEECGENSNDQEAQSARRNINLSSLDEALPIRRGLSKFIGGQSKSFGCLADAILPSAMLAKPANPYAKRRKGLSLYDDRHRSFPPLSKSRSSTSGISKRNSFGNKSNLALALSMERAQDEDEEEEVGEFNDHIMPLPRMDYRGRDSGMPPRSMSLPDIDIETFGLGKRTSSFSDLSRHRRD